MDNKVKETAEKLFSSEYEKLTELEKHVAHHICERTPISTNVDDDYSEQTTFGQKMADKVTDFGGSWTFLIIFLVVLVIWVILNYFILINFGSTFDPYPYIFLNLILSLIAAIQAPIILMSQNRQSYTDRLRAQHDYEVNLKAELEIASLHEKIDSLKQEQWKELIVIQQEQLRLLDFLAQEIKNNKQNTI